MSAERPRVGVYVCHCGGNISDTVDVEAVAKAAGELADVVVARTYPFMCSDPGQAFIVEDIKQQRLDRVVVAACSPALHEGTFRRTLARGGLNSYLYEPANIREQVSWVHPRGEATTHKAITLVAAAVGKARHLSALEPVRVKAQPTALVIGAGVAGLRAAIDLARSGLSVILVERAAESGGLLRELGPLYPDGRPAAEVLAELLQAVRAEARVEILTRTTLVESQGSVGAFEVTLRTEVEGQAPVDRRAAVGAIVMATGARPYQPQKKEFGYQRVKGVMTLRELQALLATSPTGEPLRVDEQPVRSVGFLHCVGSRQLPGVHQPGPDGRLHEHCSRVCCTAAIHTAVRLDKEHPGTRIHSFYRDIRTYGRGHEEIYASASRAGVTFHRYAGDGPPTVARAPEGAAGGTRVIVRDQLTWGEEVEVDLDLLVLVTGLIPSENGGLVDALKLAVSEDGFLQEVHPKLRPVEQATAGFYLAGACQYPKDVGETCASASAAAAKVAALLGHGEVELAPWVAQVDPARCTGTGACLEACGYPGALRAIGSGASRKVEVNPALCVGCGACVAVCPSRAISVAGSTLEQFDAMVDAIVAGRKAS